MRLDDGRAWYSRAYDALADGRVTDATSAFQRAVSTDRENPRYQLALASALVTGRRHAEARPILQALEGSHPDDPEASLQLARLEAAEGRWDDAFQHYQDTLTTLWSADQTAAGRHVRTELIELLLQQGLTARALSELLILGSNVPDDPAIRLEVGRMLLRAGEAKRAREFFDGVLAREPHNLQALSGAGEAAFVSGDYADARRLLAGVPDADPAAALRIVAGHVLTADPLAPRLPIEERRRRAARTLAHARSVLEACGTASGSGAPDARVQALADEHEAASAAFGARGTAPSREAIEQVFDLVYRIERQVGEACPEAGPLGRAILLIGVRHGLDEP